MTKKIILDLLSECDLLLSTSEIIEEALKQSKDCKDRVPQALKMLEKEGIVKKKISKSKKGFVWTLR